MSAPEQAEADTIASTAAPTKKGSSMVPLLLVVILVPTLCYVVMDFLIMPKLKTTIAAALEASEAKAGAAPGASAAKPDSKEKASETEHSIPFGPTVVNLAGTSNSRYLRVDFVIASKDATIEDIVKEHQGTLRDTTIGVLAAQSLDGLNSGEGREAVRTQLIERLNGALGSQVISQIYFSEFVVQ